MPVPCRIALSLLGLTLGLALAVPARAQPCALEGRGVATDVRPDGTDLRLLRVEAQARVRLDGTEAQLEVTDPIVFRGQTHVRSIALTLRSTRTVGGVLTVSRGTSIEARRVSQGRAHVRVDAGPTSFGMQVPCTELAFGALPPDEDGENGENVEERNAERANDTAAETVASARVATTLVHTTKVPRGRTLHVFASATGARGVRLRLDRGARWRELEVVAWHPERARVRAILAPGISVEGWVARTDLVDSRDRGLFGTGRTGGCGFGYGGTRRYRGPATLAAGAPLLDAEGRTWAHAARDLELAIAVVQTGTRGGPDGSITPVETIYVERLPGIALSACEPSGIRVRAEDVHHEAGD